MRINKITTVLITFAICLIHSTAIAQNNTYQSFNKAKKDLQNKVYYDHRETIYCGAEFNSDKSVVIPQGFTTSKHVKRSKRIEWEHVVPAENFGRL